MRKSKNSDKKLTGFTHKERGSKMHYQVWDSILSHPESPSQPKNNNNNSNKSHPPHRYKKPTFSLSLNQPGSTKNCLHSKASLTTKNLRSKDWSRTSINCNLATTKTTTDTNKLHNKKNDTCSKHRTLHLCADRCLKKYNKCDLKDTLHN